MLKSSQLVLVVAVASIVLASVGCGGTGAAPINGGSLAGVAVSVQPATMTITTGTTQPFTATVINTSETGVGWLVNGFPGGVSHLDGSTPFGTIDKNGNYTAPPFIPAPPSVTVTAVANADNSVTGNASVSINGTPSPVSISPLTANLEVGGIALFTATVKNSDPAVTWLVENVPGGNDVVGTVSPIPDTLNQVNYVAPLVVPGGNATAQVHVTAQSVALPQESASAVVNLSVLGSTVVAITSPSVPPTVSAGQTQPFQASVTGTSDTTVSWEVDAIPGGNANVGTITTEAKGAAVYTAPAQVPNPPQVIVTAVSNAQPAAQASILVNLIPAQPTKVTLTPDICANTDAVPISSQVNISVSVSGPQNQEVTWQVNKIAGGNTTVGTITPIGTTQAVFTAPAGIPAPATVIVGAVSVANSAASATAPLTITLTAMPKVLISPTSATVNASGAGADFKATVEGLGDSAAAENWSVDDVLGGNDTIGTVGPTLDEPPTGCESFGTYDPPATVPSPPTVFVTVATADGVSSPGAAVTINPPPVYTEALMPGHDDPQSVQVQPPNNKILYTLTQEKNGVIDTTDPVNWSITSQSQDCSVSAGSICGTITPTGINLSQQFTATYTAPTTVPPNPQVTVTVASAVDSSASDFNVVTIGSGAPTIAINGPVTVQAGTGPYLYNAIITGADPNTLVVWQLGCISDWDGISPDGNCQPTSKDDFKDGPGCIMYGRAKVCGAAGDLTIPGKNALSYTPPLGVSTTDYFQNVCTPNGDPKVSIVPINASMQVTGCPGGLCTAVACVTVTSP
jgi:hypothetical protein